MKNLKVTFAIATTLVCINSVNAQNVQIGNVTSGMTASGKNLTIDGQNSAMQTNKVSPMATAAMSAANNIASNVNDDDDEDDNSTPTMSKTSTDPIPNTPSAIMQPTQSVEEEAPVVQQRVSSGQDLETLRPPLRTNDIGIYNQSSLEELGNIGKQNDLDKYSGFPESLTKDY